MVTQLGEGIPSALTPARIKAVLALAKSHERILKETLDADSSPAWTGTESDGGFYERLHALIATADGRTAYEKARSEFESLKAKFDGRADLFARLLEDCLKAVSRYSKATGDSYDFEQDPVQLLVEASDLMRAAEALWAESVISGDAERLVDDLWRFPELVPYLEEVIAGLTEQEGDGFEFISEEDGEASELVNRVRRAAEVLDSDRLNERELRGIAFDSLRLAEIAEARDTHR